MNDFNPYDDESVVVTRTRITEEMPNDQPEGAGQPLVPGDTIHFCATGLGFRYKPSPAEGLISERGQSVTITSEMIELSRDINGKSVFLTYIDDEEGQLERWGKVYFRRGPAPAGMTWWTPGSIEEDWARDTALAEAWDQPAGDAQNKALEAVRRTFGAHTTSKTLSNTNFQK